MNNSDTNQTEQLNETAVMPCYFYKNGSVVKENDIVFYTEDDGSGKFRYADNISIIVKRGNDLKSKAYVITGFNNIYQNYNEPEINMCSLHYGTENWNKKVGCGGTLNHFTKIGEYPENEGMLSIDYANEFFPHNKA